MSQSYTYIDLWGLQAQYTVGDPDRRNEYYWSTDHGDHGVAPSRAQAARSGQDGTEEQHGDPKQAGRQELALTYSVSKRAKETTPEFLADRPSFDCPPWRAAPSAPSFKKEWN